MEMNLPNPIALFAVQAFPNGSPGPGSLPENRPGQREACLLCRRGDKNLFSGMKDVDLGCTGWYFCKREEDMILKVLIGVLLGGVAGFALSYLTRGIGSS